MTKFTTALAVVLAAASVPFGKALCVPGEVALGGYFDSSLGVTVYGIYANDCGAIDTTTWGYQCGGYSGGSYLQCNEYGEALIFKDPRGVYFNPCYQRIDQCNDVITGWCCSPGPHPPPPS